MSTRCCAYVLCLMFALQGGLSVFVQQQTLASLQSSLPFDIELICTGTEMKWISVSLTQSRGQLVYVDPPVDVDERLLDNACPEGALADTQSAAALLSASAHSSFVVYLALLQTLYQRPYTAFPYQTALSRGPPVFLTHAF